MQQTTFCDAFQLNIGFKRYMQHMCAICFSNLKESTFETRKMFTSPQKLFSFLRFSNIRISENQISWRCKYYILVNNLQAKYNQEVKFDQLM